MIRIGFSQGDINGTSLPQLIKLFQVEEMFDICTPVLYGSTAIVKVLCKQHNIPTKLHTCSNIEEIKDGAFNLIECCSEINIELTPGTITDESKNAAKLSLETSIQDLKTAKINALVCLPTQGVSINVTEMVVADGLRYVSLSLNNQTGIEETTESVTKALQLINTTLKRDFLIEGPRTAILTSQITTTEDEITEIPQIVNTLQEAIENEFNNRNLCFGPYNARTFFESNMQSCYDVILFADKESANNLVNAIDAFYYSLGLPVVIVGTECSNLFYEMEEGTQALRNAIFTAVDTTRNRHFYDKARTNVLRRHYYEKRDDSDKLKLD